MPRGLTHALVASAAIAGLAVVAGSLADAHRPEGAAPIPTPTKPEAAAPRIAPFAAPLAPTVREPANQAGARILQILGEIRANIRVTRYQHPTLIRPSKGQYYWDCSGMAAYVVRRAAPFARRSIASPRPVARDFYRAIERAPVGGVRGGWTRLSGLAEAGPGDVFAWLRPPDWPRRNTGHVGFLLAAPVPVPELPGAWALRIADATSLPHQQDTRPWPGDGGYGEGTIVFFADPAGRPTHYGWHGTRAGATAETRIVLGRPVR